ncbi:MAG TPA: carbon monoxide dehydrogenase subunit G [Symbiobacteriaceae bacterium]|nr:carbon monoxide dehydrogenase subunit G [Symbiobacteriaceae bacterium]
MQVTGDFLFRADREPVWQLLNDPAVLARCLPGCERLEPLDPDRYAAVVKVGLAAVKGTYEGSLVVTDKQAPESMTLRIEMNGTTGFVAVTGRMALSAVGAGQTRVSYDWDVNVGGPVAMVGQRVLGGVARWIVSEFFAAAGKELVSR